MLDALRQILPDIEDQMLQSQWQRHRRPPRESDNALNGTARRWLRELPTRQRPLRLCMSYPRVANRIAWCWRDTTLSTQVLEDLVSDLRGSRRGFPAPVLRELQRLRQFNERQRTDDGEGFWSALSRSLGPA